MPHAAVNALLYVALTSAWSCAGRSISYACCQVWCSSCLLLHVVSSLPAVPVCATCSGAGGAWRVRVLDHGRSGVQRERVAAVTPPPRVHRKIQRWLLAPAAKRRGDLALQVWVHPAAADAGDVPVIFHSILPRDMPMGGFMGDGDRSRALTVLLHHLHCRIFSGKRALSSTSLGCRTLAEFDVVAQGASGPLTRILRLLGTGKPELPSPEHLRNNYMARKDASAVQVCVDLWWAGGRGEEAERVSLIEFIKTLTSAHTQTHHGHPCPCCRPPAWRWH